MRIALKIAYDGRSFYGHQRQPDARTVEGECLVALRAAKMIDGPSESLFRSASRTDRGVSAVGNVIAFNTEFSPEAAIGAFNDRAREVWAWAAAAVPDSFHPRHAVERWYRYGLPEGLDLSLLRKAAALFEGLHDFRSFTSDPPTAPFSISKVEVRRHNDIDVIDVRAASFRRGMVRRIVAALLKAEAGEISREEIEASLRGAKRDFGMAPPEPLVLMDVRYSFPFRIVVKPKVRDDWGAIDRDLTLRKHLVDSWNLAIRESD